MLTHRRSMRGLRTAVAALVTAVIVASVPAAAGEAEGQATQIAQASTAGAAVASVGQGSVVVLAAPEEAAQPVPQRPRLDRRVLLLTVLLMSRGEGPVIP